VFHKKLKSFFRLGRKAIHKETNTKTKTTHQQQQTDKMSHPYYAMTDTITNSGFKEKHGGWAISHINEIWGSPETISARYTDAIKVKFPHLSVKMICRKYHHIIFILYGASQLDFERMVTRTHEPIGIFKNGFKLFNFRSLPNNVLAETDEKLSAPPPYTEEQAPIQPVAPIQPAWNEVQEARKKLEEERKAFEIEKLKFSLTLKMKLFDEEIEKFKTQFFTQDELVNIRKMINERF
jgi:hypothetical protein